MAQNFSSELLWECTKSFNSFQVKRSSGGGALFSRDPFNLTNRQTPKHSGFLNAKAIGLQPGSNGGVTLTTKKSGKANKPGAESQTSTISGRHGTRKTYRSVVNSTGGRGYRPDLLEVAVARTSAIRDSQRKKKDAPKSKPRSAKSKAIAAKAKAA